jgi:proline dehydrogenase
VVRVSHWRQAADQLAASTVHRNTELVLGLAVDDLWKAVPPETQRALGEVPAVAHALQRDAESLRELIGQLQESGRDMEDDPGETAALAATLEALEPQHRKAVAALEQLRLQLLRVLASREHTAALTQQLADAQELNARLARELAGHADVRRLLGRRRRRTVTPVSAPTPA